MVSNSDHNLLSNFADRAVVHANYHYFGVAKDNSVQKETKAAPIGSSRTSSFQADWQINCRLITNGASSFEVYSQQ